MIGNAGSELGESCDFGRTAVREFPASSAAMTWKLLMHSHWCSYVAE